MEKQKEYNLPYLLAKVRITRGKASDRLRQRANERNKKKRIPFIFNDESTGSCIYLRLDLYMSHLQGCAFNTRLH
jgi:hypothetical protein